MNINLLVDGTLITASLIDHTTTRDFLALWPLPQQCRITPMRKSSVTCRDTCR